MEIWSNPSCSKSTFACETLTEAGVDFTVRDYLSEPPTPAELDRVLVRLGAQPWELARMNEPVAIELGLAELPHDRERWIAVMTENPELIQRPILLLDDSSALLGRSVDAMRTAIEAARAG